LTVPFDPMLLEAHNPSPMTGRGNNTYLIIGGIGSRSSRPAVLIDAGVGNPRHLAEIDERLASEQATLETVLVTHGHADHASGASALAASHPGARFAKYPWPEQDGRYDVRWESIVEGQTIAIAAGGTIAVLYTPGHSPDHLAFWHEPTRTAFTGDLVAVGTSVMIHWSRGGNLIDYLASLERILALRPRRLLPAHGPEPDDAAALLSGYLAHRRLREEQVVAALESGRPTVADIAESIYAGLDPALMEAARENVRAHLEKLKVEGRAVDEAGRWRIHGERDRQRD
jgi:glyoxylase-like metal-dependent hydrolase (beta-lactamase superfamily II)